jgi:hypothetical protein
VSLETRFWAKVSIALHPDGRWNTEPCWLWTGAKCGGRPGGGDPYGTIRLDTPSRAMKKAHVVAFELGFGKPVKVGMDVCHRCDTPLCCNPFHLFEAKHQANMLDYIRKYGRLGIPKTDWPLPPRPTLPMEDEG